jgi:hypothetical protein
VPVEVPLVQGDACCDTQGSFVASDGEVGLEQEACHAAGKGQQYKGSLDECLWHKFQGVSPCLPWTSMTTL